MSQPAKDTAFSGDDVTVAIASDKGLTKTFAITVSPQVISRETDRRLAEFSTTAQLPGFRRGKVPVSLVRQRYGDHMKSEVVRDMINRSMQHAMETHHVKPAMEPKINVRGITDDKGLEYSIELEILPEIPELDLAAVSLERPVPDVPEEEIEKALANLAESQKHFHSVKKARAAKKGDQLIIDFKGSVDGEFFEGGSAEDFPIEIGSGRLIEGFEDGLTGMKPGEEKTLDLTFPENYGNAELAGKKAAFAVTLKEIQEAHVPDVNDGFAEKLGFEGMDGLREAVKGQLSARFDQRARVITKKRLFDAIEEQVQFDVPEGLVNAELENIKAQLGRMGAGTENEAEMREKYAPICRRRVRLGLLLAEVGRRNEITVADDQLRQAIIERARSFPGQEQQVYKYYQEDPNRLMELRGPLLEDNVVDFLLEKIKVKDISVSLDELDRLQEAIDTEEELQAAGEEKKPAKKTAAKKKPAATATEEKDTGKADTAEKAEETKPKAKKTAKAKAPAGETKKKETETKAKKPAAKSTAKKKPAAKKTKKDSDG